MKEKNIKETYFSMFDFIVKNIKSNKIKSNISLKYRIGKLILIHKMSFFSSKFDFLQLFSLISIYIFFPYKNSSTC